jgi:hypothetical protein
MKHLAMLAATAALLAQSAAAAPAVPEDFAFGRLIDLAEGAVLQTVTLPDELYRSIVHEDLSDLRVFNGQGVAVPHQLSVPPRPQGDGSVTETRPVFALYSVPGDDLIGQRTRVVTDSSGAILATEREAIHGGQRHRVTAYLVDLGSARTSPTKLRLVWTDVDGAGFAADVRVAASDDLTRWRTLVGAATLADLRSNTERLRRDSIGLPPSDARYLRVEWPQALEGVRVEQVELGYSPGATERPRRWLELEPVAPGAQEAGTLEFDSGGLYPVDRADLSLTGANPVVQVRLASRAAPGYEWIERHAGSFFSVSLAGHRVHNEPARVAQTTDRHWRLVAIGDDNDQLARQVGRLRLGWVPHTLTFLQQGPGPYTLAYGSWGTTAAAESIATLNSAIRARSEDPGAHTAAAETGPEFVLGGAQRLQPPAPPLPWKTWLLWVVLLLGVLALATMARRLMRELNRPAD